MCHQCQECCGRSISTFLGGGSKQRGHGTSTLKHDGCRSWIFQELLPGFYGARIRSERIRSLFQDPLRRESAASSRHSVSDVLVGMAGPGFHGLSDGFAPRPGMGVEHHQQGDGGRYVYLPSVLAFATAPSPGQGSCRRGRHHRHGHMATSHRFCWASVQGSSLSKRFFPSDQRGP